MPRPHLLAEYRGFILPREKLDPRFHPLGQPGQRVAWASMFMKIPYGLKVPLFVLGYCTICWNVRHWLYPNGARTNANVRIPMQDDFIVDVIWEGRFRKQYDIFRFGHVYYLMQEKRLKEAREQGLIE